MFLCGSPFGLFHSTQISLVRSSNVLFFLFCCISVILVHIIKNFLFISVFLLRSSPLVQHTMLSLCLPVHFHYQPVKRECTFQSFPERQHSKDHRACRHWSQTPYILRGRALLKGRSRLCLVSVEHFLSLVYFHT